MAEPGTGPGEVRWNHASARTCVATVADARTVADQVVLSFGQRVGEDRPGAEQAVSLVRRIALTPMTAKHMHDLLSRLIADATSSKPAGA